MPYGSAPALAAFLLAASVSFNVSATTEADPAVERHIEHVIDDIPPALIIDGEPASYTTLSARMATLRVPGVSVAVIHNGKLEWARGFGIKKLGGGPVTPDTLPGGV